LPPRPPPSRPSRAMTIAPAAVARSPESSPRLQRSARVTEGPRSPSSLTSAQVSRRPPLRSQMSLATGQMLQQQQQVSAAQGIRNQLTVLSSGAGPGLAAAGRFGLSQDSSSTTIALGNEMYTIGKRIVRRSLAGNGLPPFSGRRWPFFVPRSEMKRVFLHEGRRERRKK